MAEEDDELDGVEEWAIIRQEDHAYLYDGDGDGSDVAWERDPENASWFESESMAIAVADINGLTRDDDDERLAPGFATEKRIAPWEEDIEPDEIDMLNDEIEPW